MINNCIIFNLKQLKNRENVGYKTCEHFSKLGVWGIVKAIARTASAVKNNFWFYFRYWGWGGEDDDIYARLKYKKLNPSYLNGAIGRYKVRFNIFLLPI